MSLEELVRPNIWRLKGYSSARHEFEGIADVYLDANENPYDTDINRYPDPFQTAVKKRLSVIKGVPVENMFIGNGSDEPIDLLLRIFCEPGVDNILTFPPTYGMYQVSADINDVQIIESSLTTDYQIDIDQSLKLINNQTKVAFICSPNNPTGNLIDHNSVLRFLDSFKGISVIDEAYIDFAGSEGFAKMLVDYPRLVILQTLSKAWGAAGIRLGLAFASKAIIGLLNKIKPPYNINVLTQNRALEVLEDTESFNNQVEEIKTQKAEIIKSLGQLEIVIKIHPSDTNFLLVEFDKPMEVFEYLRSNGIVIRDRTKTHLCDNCLRITIGTPEENERLLRSLRSFINAMKA